MFPELGQAIYIGGCHVSYLIAAARKDTPHISLRISPRPYILCYGGIRPCPFRPSDSLPETHYSSRPVLESLLRRNVVNTCKNVSFLSGSVIGINPYSNDHTRISSATIKLLGDDEPQKLDAVVVVGEYQCVDTPLTIFKVFINRPQFILQIVQAPSKQDSSGCQKQAMASRLRLTERLYLWISWR